MRTITADLITVAGLALVGVGLYTLWGFGVTCLVGGCVITAGGISAAIFKDRE